jgi:hypothetical protein
MEHYVTDGSGLEENNHVFRWHPVYAGRPVGEVRASLQEDIRRDQRAHELAIEGAEISEGASLTTIVELERRWSVFDFDWTELEPAELANRIVVFELAREEREELFAFDEYRRHGGGEQAAVIAEKSATPALPVMKIGAVILVVLIVIFLVAVLL